MTVVDASAIVLLLTGQDADEMLRRRLAGAGRRLHAPAHLDVEVLSATRGLLVGKKISEDRAGEMIADYRALRITRHSTVPFAERILQLRSNFTVYDGAYVALAEALGRPLFTCDRKFAQTPLGMHRAEIHTYPM